MGPATWYSLLVLALGVAGIVALGGLGVQMTERAAAQRFIWLVSLLATVTFSTCVCLGIPVYLQGYLRGFFAQTAAASRPLVSVREANPAQAPPVFAEPFPGSVAEAASRTGDLAEQPMAASNPATVLSTPMVSITPEEGSDLAGPEVAGPAVVVSGSVSASRTDVRFLGLVLVWGIGTLACLLGWLVRRLEVWRLLWQSSPVEDQTALQWVASTSRRLGIRRGVGLIRSSRLTTPAALGVWRRRIGLPMDFAIHPLTTKAQAMLSHELGHLSGNDPFWRGFAELVWAVLWWHPAVWWLCRGLKSAAEEAADEAVLLVPDGPRELASGLLEYARRLQGGTSWAVGAVSQPQCRSPLARRVHRLLRLQREGPPGEKTLRRGRMQVGLVFLTVLSVFVASVGVPFPECPECTVSEGDATMLRSPKWWRHSLLAAAVLAFTAPWAAPARADEGPPDRPPAVERAEREDEDEAREEKAEAREAKDRRERKGEAAERREREGRERGQAEARERAEPRRDRRAREESRPDMERREEGERRGGPEAEGRRDVPRPAVAPERIERLERRLAELREQIKAAREAGQQDRVQQLKREIGHLEGVLQQLRERRTPEPARLPPEAREEMMRRLEGHMREVREALGRAREAGQEGRVLELEAQLERLERAMANVREGRPPELPPGPGPMAREEMIRRFERHMAELRARREQARQVGREEEVRRIEERLGQLERDLAAIREGRPGLPGLPRERLERARRAAELLRREGFGDMAELLMRSLQREVPPGPPDRAPARPPHPDRPRDVPRDRPALPPAER